MRLFPTKAMAGPCWKPGDHPRASIRDAGRFFLPARTIYSAHRKVLRVAIAAPIRRALRARPLVDLVPHSCSSDSRLNASLRPSRHGFEMPGVDRRGKDPGKSRTAAPRSLAFPRGVWAIRTIAPSVLSTAPFPAVRVMSCAGLFKTRRKTGPGPMAIPVPVSTEYRDGALVSGSMPYGRG